MFIPSSGTLNCIYMQTGGIGDALKKTRFSNSFDDSALS